MGFKHKLFSNAKIPTSINAIASSSQSLPSSLSPSSFFDVVDVNCLDLDFPFLDLKLKPQQEPQKKHRKKDWKLN